MNCLRRNIGFFPCINFNIYFFDRYVYSCLNSSKSDKNSNLEQTVKESLCTFVLVWNGI